MNGRVIVLILAAFGVVVLSLMAIGAVPIEVAQHWLKGSLGSPRAISGTLRETTPLLIAGIAVYLALRAGLFNIGVEGQFLVGACTAAYCGLRFGGVQGIIIGTILGIVAGALWALPAGLIKAYRGGHEVITTIMLNHVAALLTGALVAGPLKDPTQESSTTATLPDPSRLPPALQTASSLTIPWALIFGLATLVAFAFWLKRTVSGFELSATGANPSAAKSAGVPTSKVTVMAMAASGAIGGLAGALQVFAFDFRFYDGFSPGYGFDALGVALLAGAAPLAILPSALLFGILSKGGTAVQLLGIPKGLNGVLLGLLIISFAAVRYQKRKKSA